MSREIEYEGSGKYSTSEGTHLGIQFTVTSADTVGKHGVWFLRSGAGVPDERRYVLAPLEAGRGFTAYYIRTTTDTVEAFTAVSGEVTILRSGSSSVEGEFQFTAVRYCAAPIVGLSEPCGDPNEIDVSAARVELRGTFVAVPYEPGDLVLD